MKKKFIAINLGFLLLFAPASIFAKSFTDIRESGNYAWAYKYVDELSNKNILSGYEDGSFKPNNPVSFLEIMQILKTVLNPRESEMQSARDAYLGFVNSMGIMDWARDGVCYNLYHGTVTENTITRARERGFLESKVYPNRNTIAVYYARALGIEKNNDTSNLNYKDANNINSLTLEYLPNLVSGGIFTSTGSDGNFNGNLAIRRSEIAVITSKALSYLEGNRDKISGPEKLIEGQDSPLNMGKNNSIFESQDPKDSPDELKAADVHTLVNFKGEVIEVIDAGKAKYIRVRITETDSNKYNPGNIITLNIFRSHKVNEIVEGTGILDNNSLTNIKLK